MHTCPALPIFMCSVVPVPACDGHQLTHASPHPSYSHSCVISGKRCLCSVPSVGSVAGCHGLWDTECGACASRCPGPRDEWSFVRRFLVRLPLLLQAGTSQQQRTAPEGPTEVPSPFPGPRWAELHGLESTSGMLYLLCLGVWAKMSMSTSRPKPVLPRMAWTPTQSQDTVQSGEGRGYTPPPLRIQKLVKPEKMTLLGALGRLLPLVQ